MKKRMSVIFVIAVLALGAWAIGAQLSYPAVKPTPSPGATGTALPNPTARPTTTSRVSALIQALEDEDEDVRKNAAEALGRIGPEAISALIQALEDENADVRSSAAQALSTVQASLPGSPLRP